MPAMKDVEIGSPRVARSGESSPIDSTVSSGMVEKDTVTVCATPLDAHTCEYVRVDESKKPEPAADPDLVCSCVVMHRYEELTCPRSAGKATMTQKTPRTGRTQPNGQ